MISLSAGLKFGKFSQGSLNSISAPLRVLRAADFDSLAGDGVEIAGAEAPAGLELGLVVAGPVHVDGALAPVDVAKLLAAPGVEIPFDGVAAPEVGVVGAVELPRVERSQAGVERRVVPHVEELGGPVFQQVRFLQLEVIDGRAERALELAEVAVDLHVGRGASGEAADAGFEIVGVSACVRRQTRATMEQNQNDRSMEHGPRCLDWNAKVADDRSCSGRRVQARPARQPSAQASRACVIRSPADGGVLRACRG